MKKIIFTLITLLFILPVTAQQRWQLSTGPFGGNVFSICDDGRGFLYAGTETGIYQSNDGGENWVYTGPLFDGNLLYATCFAVDSAGTIYAGINDTRCVYRSADRGLTWTQAATGLTAPGVASLYIGTHGYIYAGTSEGVFRSTDGMNWSNVGLTDSYVSCFGLNSAGDILAGTNRGASRSPDDGDSWIKMRNEGFPSATVINDYILTTEGLLYAATTEGLYQWRDIDSSWVLRGGVQTNVTTLGIDSAGNIFGGVQYQVRRLSESGTSWIALSDSTVHLRINRLILNSQGVMYVAMNGDGIYRSADKGATWTETNNGMQRVQAFCMAANSANNIFAGTWGSGMYRSLDGAFTWERISKGLSDFAITSVVVNPSGHIFIGTYGGAYRSTDNGENWTRVNNGLSPGDVVINCLAIDSLGNLYAGTRYYFMAGQYGGTIYKSTDEGDTWTKIGPEGKWMTVNSIAVNPKGYIYAVVTDEGIYRSTDSGSTWPLLNSDTTTKTVLSVSYDRGALYSTSVSGGLCRSMDDGDNWSCLYLFPCNAVAITSNGVMYTGSFYWGVYASIDSGKTFLPLMDGLTNTSVNTIILDKYESLLAGTWNGVFRLSNSSSPPPAPVLRGPVNGATRSSQRVDLFWNPSDAIEYRVQVSASPTFENKIIDDSTIIEYTHGLKSLDTDTSYYWRVSAKNQNGVSQFSPAWNFSTRTTRTGIEQSSNNVPKSYFLSQNYPNPFNPTTKIEYSIPRQGKVTIKIFDIRGAQIATILDEVLQPGHYIKNWDASRFSSGIYFYQIKASGFTSTKKLVLIK